MPHTFLTAVALNPANTNVGLWLCVFSETTIILKTVLSRDTFIQSKDMIAVMNCSF